MGSTDRDGYRRGSFGIGENESKVLWVIVGAALVFGGSIDEEKAAKIRAAQSGCFSESCQSDTPSASVLSSKAVAKAALKAKIDARKAAEAASGVFP